jgi:hypothetical protein
MSNESEVNMSLQSTGLFFTEEQVHLRMTVALCLEGNPIPIEDETGPLVLKCLLGGVPTRKKLYPVNSIVWTPASPKPDPLEAMFPVPKNCRCPGALSATSMAGFRSDVRFMPVQVFSAAELPHDTECLVFVNGERLQYGEKRGAEYTVTVYSNTRGEIISTGGEEYGFLQRPFALPEGTVLVPISEVGAYQVPAPAIGRYRPF